jgi:6-pyruvoyltetrahydropterin/6-carboxytetrahydropterin synthase
MEAAHFLPMVPKGHKCSRLHGHSFFVSVDCLCNEKISDYFHLTNSFSPLLQNLRGCLLNELPGLQNPTSENLARYIFKELQAELPEIFSVTVFETRTAGSTYYGQNKWDCFKDFEFDSAVPSAKNFTGHTYFVRLSIQGQADENAGWILDFADIKEGFKPHYKELDHHLLSESNGQDLSSLNLLSNWIFQKLKPEIPLLHSVTIKENDNFAICLKENS